MAHLLMIESFIGGNALILPDLLKELGYTYTFLTRSRKIYESSFSDAEHIVIKNAKEIFEVDTNDLETVIKTVRGMSFDGVITTCDYYIDMVSDVAMTLALPCPFPKKVKNVRYKHKLRQFLKDAKLANPKYGIAYQWSELLETAQHIGYPLVLKPVDLASSAFVRFVENENDLKDAFEKLHAFPINWRNQKRDGTYLLEEYMSGDEVSVESVTYEGETQIVGITQKSLMGAPYFIEEGHMFPANLPSDLQEEIKDYVIKALEATGYDHGVSHTEVKLTTNGPKIVEINPRCPGGHIVEIIELVCNVDMLTAFIDLALDKKPQIASKESEITSASVRFLTPEKSGKVKALTGIESLAQDVHVVSYQIEDCVGKLLGDPIDNAGRIGRVITRDNEGYRALKYANEAISRLQLIYE